MLYKVVPTFESVNEILKCVHSNESYWAVLFCGAVYYPVQGGSNVWFYGRNLVKSDHSNEKAAEQYFLFLWCCLFFCTRWKYRLSLWMESLIVTIQLRRTFLWHCLLSCTRWFSRMILWTKFDNVTIQMKSTEQYFPVVLLIMLYKMVLTFESVDEILKCDHSIESCWAVLYCSAVMLYKVAARFMSVWIKNLLLRQAFRHIG